MFLFVLIYVKLQLKKMKIAKISPEIRLGVEIKEYIGSSILQWFCSLPFWALAACSKLSEITQMTVLRAESRKVILAVEYSRKYFGPRLDSAISHGVILGFLKPSLNS